jgi:predicted small lipoprotein YifL
MRTAAFVVALVALAACGIKGDPVPPEGADDSAEQAAMESRAP